MESQTNFLDAEIPAWQGGKARPEPVPPSRQGEHSGRPQGELRERTAAQREKILALFAKGPATNLQLEEIAHRFGARIYELRRDGYTIEKRHLGGPIFQYELIQ